jgi:hypothetical protein
MTAFIVNQIKEATSPNININKANFSCDEMLPMDAAHDDNGSEKSSNGWTSHSGRSGNEGSAELSNGHEKNKMSFVESISVDSEPLNLLEWLPNIHQMTVEDYLVE